jgi:hypothetical protein
VATWDELKRFVQTNFDVTELSPNALELTTVWQDLPHRVWVTSGEGPEGEPWAQIDSPIGQLGSIDLVRALNLVENAACGGLCRLLVQGVELVSLRHCVPLETLDQNEFLKPLFILNAAGAAFSAELTQQFNRS